MKVVINSQYGGFNLSKIAIEEYLKLKGEQAYFYDINSRGKEVYYKKSLKNTNSDIFFMTFTKDFGPEIKINDISEEDYKKYSFNSKDIKRIDKDLIKVIEELGEKANTKVSTLKIVDIPDDIKWTIEEYDGNEWIAEEHRIWS